MRPICDSYFELLDANNDCILQNDELMTLLNIFSTDENISAEDKFNALFALVDTDGDGKCDKNECVEFGHKCYDVGVASVKSAVEIYQEIAKAVAVGFFALFMQKIAGGDELTKDQFNDLASSFEEHGPEVLLAPLMEGME